MSYRIIQRGPEEQHPERERHKRPECPNPGLWISPGSPTSELELWEFLYGLVRVLKPAIVFESGCHLGYATRAIGLAVKENGFGNVFSCDTEENMVRQTRKRVEGLPVTVYSKPALECRELLFCDFLFCDSSYESRMAELAKLKEGAVAVVHDTWQEKQLREVTDLFRSVIHFDTPRGFSMLKVSRSRAKGVERSCGCMHQRPEGGCPIHDKGTF